MNHKLIHFPRKRRADQRELEAAQAWLSGLEIVAESADPFLDDLDLMLHCAWTSQCLSLAAEGRLNLDPAAVCGLAGVTTAMAHYLAQRLRMAALLQSLEHCHGHSIEERRTLVQIQALLAPFLEPDDAPSPPPEQPCDW